MEPADVYAPAASSAATSSRESLISGAFRISSSCLRLVALTIGAVMIGFAISQASAICAGNGVVARGHLVERLEDAHARAHRDSV